MKNHEKQEGVWPMWNPSGFANWGVPKLGSSPPTEAGRQGPIFRCCLKQTVNSFGSFEFSLRGGLGSSRRCRLELLETVLIFCSRLCRPRLKPSGWEGSGEPGYRLVKERIFVRSRHCSTFFYIYYSIYCSQNPCEVDDVVVPTLQMRKLRCRDINKFIWTVRAKN